MAKTLNNIAKYRKLRGLSQPELAEKVGAHAITISNLERGHAVLTMEWLSRLAEVLEVEEAALLALERPQRVYVAGELSSDSLMLWGETEGRAVAIAEGASPMAADVARWIVVRDNSLYPTFQELDVVRLFPIIETVPHEFNWAMGRLAVAVDDKNRTRVGFLHRGFSGEISMAPISGPPLINVKLTQIFVIDRAIYGPKFPDKPAVGKPKAKKT